MVIVFSFRLNFHVFFVFRVCKQHNATQALIFLENYFAIINCGTQFTEIKFIKMKKNIFTILLIITSSVIQSQTVKKNTVYFSISSGLSRSEDGLAFLLKDSAKQWSPMINLGVGYRYNKNFGLELNGSTMITPISAEGVLVSNNGNVEIEAKHSNIILSPKVFLPFSNKSEIFLKVGCGILFSKSTITTSSNNDNEVFTNNFGYLIGLGYNKKVGESLVFSAQFDFSDSYGKKDVWTGDLGLLHVGISYSFNRN